MISINNDVCGCCGACVSVCPNNALMLIETEIKIDETKCRFECKICSTLCPLEAITVKKPEVKHVFTVE